MTSTVQAIVPLSSQTVRAQCRDGSLNQPTTGLAMGYVQTNLVILPSQLAFEFLLFCQRNPKPCPVLEVLDKGNPQPKQFAPGADIRTDLPRYRVFKSGELIEERTDIQQLWTDDMVGILIGCSFSFEEAMLKAGLTIRHIEEEKNVPMYRTTLNCQPQEAIIQSKPASAITHSPGLMLVTDIKNESLQG